MIRLLAPVNKILPYSVVDGPGNRVSVFLQKCNIHCAYCHNPETQQMCCNCGVCVDGCPVRALSLHDGTVQWDSALCCGCDHCIQICPHHASPKIRWMTAHEVWGKIQESIPFIRGITVSGGECSLYPDFLTELFTIVRAHGLTCLMDSNGTTDLSQFPELMACCDGVMLDVKSWDKDVYRKLTGGDNDIVKQNLQYLGQIGKLEEIRVVCLPELVDAPEVIRGISETLGEKATATVLLKLIGFRPFGVRGSLRSMSQTSMAYMKTLAVLAQNTGFQNVLIV